MRTSDSVVARAFAMFGFGADDKVRGKSRRTPIKRRKMIFESLESRRVCDDGADIFENCGEVVGGLDFTGGITDVLENDSSLADVVFTG
jgi:hypothetical protein